MIDQKQSELDKIIPVIAEYLTAKETKALSKVSSSFYKLMQEYNSFYNKSLKFQIWQEDVCNGLHKAVDNFKQSQRIKFFDRRNSYLSTVKYPILSNFLIVNFSLMANYFGLININVDAFLIIVVLLLICFLIYNGIDVNNRLNDNRQNRLITNDTEAEFKQFIEQYFEGFVSFSPLKSLLYPTAFRKLFYGKPTLNEALGRLTECFERLKADASQFNNYLFALPPIKRECLRIQEIPDNLKNHAYNINLMWREKNGQSLFYPEKEVPSQQSLPMTST
ncbi:hypothetical protein [Legionella fairfieldensis]|uniref:hypothetical protein n=1 Tax=Legionella fairfieldensis TaxID=45064 RepID=UPI00048D85E8|nr:hypothetical protein [Legionella fairfieldensis]